MEKKLLVITGASDGIGRSIAEIFIANSWDVVNLSRKLCSVPKVVSLSIDLSIQNSINILEKLLSEIIIGKRIICIVHNAAAYQKDNITNLASENLRSILEVNVVAPLRINQLLLPYMLEGSSILYIGSTLSEKAVPNAASYSISKHTSVGMMRATTQDLAQFGIYSACICPGFTNTKMLQQHLSHNEHLISSITNNICMQRLVEPNEIANLVFFSANNSIINGAVLHANLGQIES